MALDLYKLQEPCHSQKLVANETAVVRRGQAVSHSTEEACETFFRDRLFDGFGRPVRSVGIALKEREVGLDRGVVVEEVVPPPFERSALLGCADNLLFIEPDAEDRWSRWRTGRSISTA
jgi:hypothetical protein